MISLRASLLGLALLAGGTVSALAADLGNLRDDDMSSAAAARFYLRGDVGYDWNRAPSLSQLGGSLDSASMGAAFNYGGGIGWFLSPNWRMDITAEHHNDAKVSGSTVGPLDTTIVGPATEEFNVSSNVVLANLYYDFASRAGFNPYLGVGLGWASNSAHGATATDGVTPETFDDATQSNFAWALMAGVTRELDHGFNLDVGYRYLNVGSAHTGDLFDTTALATTAGTGISTGNIGSHEIRVGLRYDVN